MIANKFWKIFWLGFFSIALVGSVVPLYLFFTLAQPGDILAAVGVSYEAGKDPFETTLLGGGSLSSGYLYQNALPLRFQSWTWEALAAWRSTEEKSEGTASLKAIFTAPGGSVGMNGPKIDVTHYKSISLSVYPDAGVDDLYIDLYDAQGNSFGRQSLGWYASSSALIPGVWQKIMVPLSNIIASVGSAKGTIVGFSISAKNSGTAYIDEVRLTSQTIEYPQWVQPPEIEFKAFNPFATSTPSSIPYTFSPSPDAMLKWYTYFGSFGTGGSGHIKVGPSGEQKTNGSMTVMRGGVSWTNYEVATIIDWGQASVFSLLVRFVDDGDFVSCAFSRYGETVQLYHVMKGESTFISQSPPLSVKDYEPWKDVHLGAKVLGNRVSCIINGEEILSNSISNLSPSGTVGIETWDTNPYAAPHTLKSLVVSPLASE